MRFRAIIFDIDGTLVDSLRIYQVAFNNGIAEFGLSPVSAEALAEKLYDGLTLEEIIVSFYPDRRDPSFLTACGQHIIAAFRDITDEQSSLLPGTTEVLETLSAQGLALGVATGRMTPSERVKEWLHAIGIGHYFQAVVTAADVAERKPAPDCVLECARQLGIPVCDCLVVGDSTSDIDAAKAAGANAVAVLTGIGGKHVLSALEPLAVLADLSGLIPFLGLDGNAGIEAIA